MNDSGEENNYISGNSEIISSKNVSSRGLLHPLRGSPLPEGAKVATTSNEIPNRSPNPNLKKQSSSNVLFSIANFIKLVNRGIDKKLHI